MGTDRFPREIHIIAQMQHPHILPLYDSGATEGFLYYVMPFVDGESLRAKLARVGSSPSTRRCGCSRRSAIALSYAHARGIVHRDIKPDNVMLSGRHAAVTDFGVAKAVSASAGGQAHHGRDRGRAPPQYMAPEQAMAEANIDARVDLYALGVMGYEMLTGHPPFEATTAQAILSAHVLEQPKDVREVAAQRPSPAGRGAAQSAWPRTRPTAGRAPTSSWPSWS
jgi:serine/threonine-protein kinase